MGADGGHIEDGQEEDFYFENDTPYDLAKRLHDVMYDVDGKSWVACKVSIIRATRDINIKFEYENEEIWDTPLHSNSSILI